MDVRLTVHRVVEDQGEQIVFAGNDSDGREWWFVTDEDKAEDILAGLRRRDGQGVVVEVEAWQLVGSAS